MVNGSLLHERWCIVRPTYIPAYARIHLCKPSFVQTYNDQRARKEPHKCTYTRACTYTHIHSHAIIIRCKHLCEESVRQPTKRDKRQVRNVYWLHWCMANTTKSLAHTHTCRHRHTQHIWSDRDSKRSQARQGQQVTVAPVLCAKRCGMKETKRKNMIRCDTWVT